MHAADDSFGTYDRKMRDVGWTMCCLNPHSGQLSNHWISLHEQRHVAEFIPLLVMDVWEHAYLLDYRPAERASYIKAFFANIAWKALEKRLQLGAPAVVHAA